ncbi:unnamed protein product [Didymodactylos carnosus]|uniref:LITAF domain-containing protein n=1 Tax=Didymodactylos carnosus TaxID=1234261 RepID=A0A815HQC8_9BILA|nr:unnamed protein product [Didymodactylos carnosus]CAF1355682.1 unnamed protein product [Didymodactylos carnosus]CAF3866637.1 unnamed protein product [Didymodactylos carnosus]CAF4229188.1 unnamed protein product [Didymodactylos carnosus]
MYSQPMYGQQSYTPNTYDTLNSQNYNSNNYPTPAQQGVSQWQQPVYQQQPSTYSQLSTGTSYQQPLQQQYNYMDQQQQQPVFVANPNSQNSTIPQQQPVMATAYSQPTGNYIQQNPPPSYDAAVSQQKNPPFVMQGTMGPGSPQFIWPRQPIQVQCPQCGATVITRTETAATILTFLLAICLFIFTFFLACLPFCIKSCKSYTHYCPNCNNRLGVRKAFS